VYVTGKGGTNEISQFATLGSGALRPLTPRNVASGDFPYDIAVSPQGTSAYAVDNLSNTAGAVSQYTLNPATGKLTPMPPRTVAGAGSPIGIKVAPDGRYLYITTGTQCLAPKGTHPAPACASASANTVSVSASARPPAR
jgi:DNA-binding beta-propeller fold protein YncE